MPLGADGLIPLGFFTELAGKAGGIVLPMLEILEESISFGQLFNYFFNIAVYIG